MAGVVALIGGGVVGVFPFLRKRTLISNAISHATSCNRACVPNRDHAGRNRAEPYVANGRRCAYWGLWHPSRQWIKNLTRLAEDTAIGTVLSVFFGFGLYC